MTEKEFIDLLRFYFRNVKKEEVEEILADYTAHFAEGRKKGLSEEEISKELGHPKDIYESYVSEGVADEETKSTLLKQQASRLTEKAEAKWAETSPKIPGAAAKTAKTASHVVYWACIVIAVLVFIVTAFLLFLLSSGFVISPAVPALPVIHPLTGACIAGAGFFLGLTILFAGREIRRRFDSTPEKGKEQSS